MCITILLQIQCVWEAILKKLLRVIYCYTFNDLCFKIRANLIIFNLIINVIIIIINVITIIYSISY